ncbi:MAG: hypothetical protein HY554_02960 [Elusimicrobia bacterium]|nr:hypothetical protein [Elusimicrobiota bacterium]
MALPGPPEGSDARRRLAIFATALLTPSLLVVGYLVLGRGAPEEALPAIAGAGPLAVPGGSAAPDRPQSSPLPWSGDATAAPPEPARASKEGEVSDELRRSIAGAFGGAAAAAREEQRRQQARRRESEAAALAVRARLDSFRKVQPLQGSAPGTGASAVSSAVAPASRKPAPSGDAFFRAFTPRQLAALNRHRSSIGLLEACKKAGLTEACQRASQACLSASGCGVWLAGQLEASAPAGLPHGGGAPGGAARNAGGGPAAKAPAGAASAGGGSSRGGGGQGKDGHEVSTKLGVETATTVESDAFAKLFPDLARSLTKEQRDEIEANIEDGFGVWGACFKLEIYQKCEEACTQAGTASQKCRPLAGGGWAACRQYLDTDAACYPACKGQAGCTVPAAVEAALCGPAATPRPSYCAPPPAAAATTASSGSGGCPAVVPQPGPHYTCIGRQTAHLAVAGEPPPCPSGCSQWAHACDLRDVATCSPGPGRPSCAEQFAQERAACERAFPR